MLVDLRGTGYYIPSAYAASTEIIALRKVVAEYDVVFVVHQRSEAVSPGFARAAGGTLRFIQGRLLDGHIKL
jgi:hypothetical protein